VSSRPWASLGVIGATQPSSTDLGGGKSEIIRGRCAERQLPSRDAELLVLKYAEGYGARELAVRLGATVSIIEARLHRARRRLRAELANMAVEFESNDHENT
jgi:Sigma-70, region 4